jgi:CelD/BcsL family acetyltransferase involved in cellulose biosynthesis
LRISLQEHADLGAAEAAWRELEPRADASFFRGAAWTFCRAAARFDDPVLLEARWRDRVVALGLLNRRGWMGEPDTLWLGESGRPEFDAVFIEHNGLLVERGWSGALHAACLRALASRKLGGRAAWRGRRVMLSGVDARLAPALDGAGLRVRTRSVRAAPRVDLAAIRAAGGDYLASLSANTRAQLRRSDRRYGAAGALRVDRASTPGEAHAALDALAVLHQRSWTARGAPGAFANPEFAAFHHSLIDRGFHAGAIDLLRVAAGAQVIGYLYNFRHRGQISAYQSGFAYAPADRQLKPGLTCHARAIDLALAEGCSCYDFLAGDSRYKRSLANADGAMGWLELLPRCSARGWLVGLAGR